MLNDLRELPLNERMLYVLVIGLAFGLILGYFMQRASQKRKAVRGGMGAQLFHYLAASTLSGLIPVIITAIVSELPILRVIASGLTFSLTTWLLLFGYAYFESRAKVLETAPQRELD